MTRNPTAAYRQTAGQNANPVHLVVVLYEQIIQDLRRALQAMEKNDIEGRTHEIDHALCVIGHLQGTLDLEKGGQVARNLQGYYQLLQSSLLQAHIQVSPAILQNQIDNLLELRAAWMQVEQTGAGESAPTPPPPATDLPNEKSGHWSA